MASSSGPSRPIPIGEPAVTDEAADTQPPAASSSTSDALRPTQDTCPWRTRDLCHQECSRFFDCPSHILERRNSTSDAGHEPTALHGSPATGTGALGPEREASNDPMSHFRMPDGQRTEGMAPRWDTVAPGPVETPLPTWSGNLSGSATLDNGQMSIPSRTSSTMQTNGGASRPGSSPRSQSHDTPNPLLDMSRDRHMTAHAPSAPDEYRGSSSRTTRMEQPSEGGRVRPQTQTHEEAGDGGSTECMLPRWQPDAEVTYCPICHTQFSIFARKHHCRFAALDMPGLLDRD
ncbi:zinc finger domain-containing protein [Ophiocordyceps sinensis CO18]|uniref:Zinc finger domain-containing protein n=1 Tax=Ophiocordyceps sinensis (strain Co18 / CGMCC 3.14243) TaxID=911162 RepID=T5AG07_OPHSC|nr:zinc finger domain-containing protein [Ophiocordyceps sinensis CO18]